MGKPLSPSDLWHQAGAEHPDDVAARRQRYRDLCAEHGVTTPARPGESRNLPCGWPGEPAAVEPEHEGFTG